MSESAESTGAPIEGWVAAASTPDQGALRKAVHTTLTAISAVALLRESMFLKGGILLAIRYQGVRHTKDVDFATTASFEGFDQAAFLEHVRQGLVVAVDALPYELECLVQGTPRVKPKGAEADFQTLMFNIGYAEKGGPAHKSMLRRGRSAHVLSVDYSFNERVLSEDVVPLTASTSVRAYGLIDVVAEKLRAMNPAAPPQPQATPGRV